MSAAEKLIRALALLAKMRSEYGVEPVVAYVTGIMNVNDRMSYEIIAEGGIIG